MDSCIGLHDPVSGDTREQSEKPDREFDEAVEKKGIDGETSPQERSAANRAEGHARHRRCYGEGDSAGRGPEGDAEMMRPDDLPREGRRPTEEEDRGNEVVAGSGQHGVRAKDPT
jgi:hypothetical protein